MSAFSYRSLDATPAPEMPSFRGPDTIRAYTHDDCRIVLDSGVVFDSSGTAIKETQYLLGEQDLSAHVFSDMPELANRNVVLCYNAGWRNYYHWLIQAVFTMYLHAPSAEADDVYVFPSPLESRKHFMELAGLDPARIVFLHKNRNVRASKATILDSTYSRLVYSPSPEIAVFARSVLAKIKPVKSEIKRFYISRRDSKNRAVENEGKVEAMLQARGFQPVVLSELDFGQQAVLFAGAETIVASHGAGLSNTIFCQPGTRVLELFPTTYVNPCFMRLGQILDLRWEGYGFPAKPANRQQEIVWSVDLGTLGEAL